MAVIRPLADADVERVREIEVLASELFRAAGLPEVADDEPDDPAELRRYAAAGNAFVVLVGSRPVGYLLLRELDGNGYIAQVSVDPGYARRGLGAQLIDRADRWARERGLAALVLTTFATLPWNAPYYRRLGFTEITGLPPGLAAVRAEEAAAGLDRWPRLAMRRPLSG